MHDKLDEISKKVEMGALTWRDVVERATLRLVDKLHPQLLASRALKDTADYLGISIDDACAEAKDARLCHKEAWYTRERRTEHDIQMFYAEDKRYLFTLPMHYRVSTWHFVVHMLPSGGRILEYGCGTADMTEWLLKRYPPPRFEYTVADLAVASTLPFVRYRFRGQPVTILEIGLGEDRLPLRTNYDFVTCVEVLEHCVNPLKIVEHLYGHLTSGGILYLTYPVDRAQLESGHNSENLTSSAQQRDAVIDFLERNCVALKSVQRLEPSQDSLWGWESLGIYRKVGSVFDRSFQSV